MVSTTRAGSRSRARLLSNLLFPLPGRVRSPLQQSALCPHFYTPRKSSHVQAWFPATRIAVHRRHLRRGCMCALPNHPACFLPAFTAPESVSHPSNHDGETATPPISRECCKRHGMYRESGRFLRTIRKWKTQTSKRQHDGWRDRCSMNSGPNVVRLVF